MERVRFCDQHFYNLSSFRDHSSLLLYQHPLLRLDPPFATDGISIRYAAAPTGALRWQPPHVPNINRSETLPARAPASTCPQNGYAFVRPTGVLASEDCLFLNVWGPAKASNLPVLVWLHGGGYGLGTANDIDFVSRVLVLRYHEALSTLADRMTRAPSSTKTVTTSSLLPPSIDWELSVFSPPMRCQNVVSSTQGYWTSFSRSNGSRLTLGYSEATRLELPLAVKRQCYSQWPSAGVWAIRSTKILSSHHPTCPHSTNTKTGNLQRTIMHLRTMQVVAIPTTVSSAL